MKSFVKKIACEVISRVGRQQWYSPKRSLLILMYHRILPANHRDLSYVQPGMVVEPDTFHMHLVELKKLFTVMHLDEWIDKVKNGEKVPRKTCAITFDDGWQDNYKYAFPILQVEKVPATIFLVSDLIDTNKSFWPERLGRILSEYAYHDLLKHKESEELGWLKNFYLNFNDSGIICSRLQIDNIVNFAKQESDEKIAFMLDKLDDVLDKPKDKSRDILNWKEVNEMQNSNLIHFGSHTRHHTRLNDNLSKNVMCDEIVTSKAILEEKLKNKTELFCFPNGDFTKSAKDMVQTVYSGACTTVSGWNTPNTDLMVLKRIGVHQDITSNRRSFLARLSGWL